MDSSSPPPPHVSSSIFQFTPNSSSSSSASNFPVLVIAIIGILATAFLLVSYYIFVIKCCLNWHRFDLLRRFSLSLSRRRSDDAPPPSYSPAAVSRGLDESLIRLIPVIRFRKEEEGDETEYLECAVCLSDFREGEKLRVIPNCCHAFHIDCIDIWLQSNANCPVCRSCISSNTLCSIDRIPKHSNGSPHDPTQFPENDDDYVVIGILQNNLDDPRLVRRSDSGDLSPISIVPSPRKPEDVRPKDDECINVGPKDDDFDRVYPIRRSISMDLSSRRQLCSEIPEVLEHGREEPTSSSSEERNRGNRKSFFSFGGGRGGARSAVLPLQLDS